MKTITLELPDSVDIVSSAYFSVGFANTWCLTSGYQPKDGMRVIIHDAPDRDHPGTVEYVEGNV